MSKKSKAQKKKINFEDPGDQNFTESTAEVVETTAVVIEDSDSGGEDLSTSDSAAGEGTDYFEEANDESKQEKEKFKIEFPFSELIRAKIPKVFDVAEVAATQWKNDEKFENLGISHPVAEIAITKALEKAKGVEKKLEEKGVISAAKMGIAVAKFQAQDLIKKFKKNE
jgi:hypothetical protein